MIYVVWATFKQNTKHSSKKVSLISYRLFLCSIWHQKVVKHTFKNIFLSWMCSFVHARAFPCTPICFGACKWHTSLHRQVATMEKCPWLLARSGLHVQRGRLSLASLHGEDQFVRDPRISAVALTLTLSFWGFRGNVNTFNILVFACQSTCYLTASLWHILGWVSFGKRSGDGNGAVQCFH